MIQTRSDGQQAESAPHATEAVDPVDEKPLDEDEVFHLLQTERRRLVLHYLRGREGSVVMRDMAEQIAAWEHDTTVQALTSKQRQRVYIALYQSHLDALADAGVIEYNKPRGIVEPTDRIEQLYRYLPDEENASQGGATAAGASLPDRDTTTFYAGASLFSTGLLTASWIGLFALPAAAVTAIIIALFTVVTLSTTIGM